jgi:hypothetical protein
VINLLKIYDRYLDPDSGKYVMAAGKMIYVDSTEARLSFKCQSQNDIFTK